MGRSAVRLLLASAMAVAPASARADASLAVTRGDEAGRCPDETELRRLASASLVPSSSAPTHVYRVTFQRSGVGYRTEVLDETTRRSRRLEDRGPGCVPIAQAAAVVLATMWSSEREPPEAPELSPQPAVQVVPEREVTPPRLPPTRALVFGAGPALASGVVRPAAAAALAEFALESEPWSIGVSALWVPDQRLPLGPGAIDVQLMAAGARGCTFVGHEARVGLCGRLLGGMLLANASGFNIDGQTTRPWFAAGLEVFVEGPLGPRWLRYRSAAGALVPLHAETFSVTGVGTAYGTPGVGGLFTLAVEFASGGI
jgi:hypothetical protein